MSDVNPYASSGDVPPAAPVSRVFPPHESVNQIRKVKINSIELLKRGYALMGDQYWLFVGITLVGIFLGSMVPFGIILGAMLVGIYLCFMHREAGYRVEFGTLFKGFDKFQESFIAMLVFLAVLFVFMMVFGFLAALVVGAFFALQGQGNEEGLAVAGVAIMIAMYTCMIFASMLLYIPFLFAFQLIADRGLSGMDAVKASWAGAKMNLVGVFGFLIVNTIISMVAALMCYVPAILFMPISLSGLFVLYRDIYGPRQQGVDLTT